MRLHFYHLTIALLLAAIPGRAQQLLLKPDKANGVYQLGETVHWVATWTNDSPAPSASYFLYRGGPTNVGHGDLKFYNNVARLDSKIDAPSTLLLAVNWSTPDGKGSRVTAGVVAAPDQITLSAPRPADFDAFWTAKLKELELVPPNPKLEPGESGNTNVAYWKISMDNLRGSHIQGQLARPATGKKLPAILLLQRVGLYPLQTNWVVNRAAEGWLALNILAHDLPIDQPRSFYDKHVQSDLKNYWTIGNDDRETSYFLRMYLSCYRAAQYLSERPDWDGQTLVVTGENQGGQQTLVTAALFPKITAAMALVPAGCDMLGPEAGRKGGWPQWYANTAGKDAQRVREASRYYDTANFASMIKCPILIGLGLRDETCPPAGIFAAINQITAPKEVVILPTSEHQDSRGTQAAYRQRHDEVWLKRRPANPEK